jgi:hypothetical protein
MSSCVQSQDADSEDNMIVGDCGKGATWIGIYGTTGPDDSG